MPVLLTVDKLEPGMRLARNVENTYNVLIHRGKRLSDADIQSLQRRFPDLSVLVSDPILDDMAEFQDDSQDYEISREVRKNVSTLSNKISESIRHGVTLKAENVNGIKQVIQDMVDYLLNNPVTTAIIEQSRNWDEYLQSHSANVFYLSMVMGNTLRNFIKRERDRLSNLKYVPHAMNLTPLATAALFHDIGMIPIEKIYSKTDPLTPEEIQAIRNHPILGADMLPEGIHPMAKLAVLTHHENRNGTGYPQKLSGDKISVFARILRIADAYAAATNEKVFQKAKSPVLALYEMMYGSYRCFYDPVVMKVFTSIIQPLPIGAKIKLADERWAVVVQHNNLDPFDPKLLIAFDELGDPLDKSDLKPPFSLRQKKDVRVASFCGEDISYINHIPEEPPAEMTESLPVAEQKELFEFVYP